eukprot:EG_transcript_19275
MYEALRARVQEFLAGDPPEVAALRHRLQQLQHRGPVGECAALEGFPAAALGGPSPRGSVSYSEELQRDPAFLNPYAVERMASSLGVDLAGSLLRQPTAAPAGDYRELRRQQNASYSREHTLEGVRLNHLGQYAAAIQQYERALQGDRHNADALIGRGAALANLGRLKAATADFEEALRLVPDHRNARTYLAATRAKLEQGLEAREAEQVAGKKGPGPRAPAPRQYGGKHYDLLSSTPSDADPVECGPPVRKQKNRAKKRKQKEHKKRKKKQRKSERRRKKRKRDRSRTRADSSSSASSSSSSSQTSSTSGVQCLT